MSLLPSEPDTSAADEADPRVLDVNSEDAEAVLSALTADTARDILGELHADPAPPAAVADRVGTSLQNAQYHLNKLEDAGAIEVVDTIYSEKGREMNVYAPADRPLVIFAGDQEETTGIRTALSRLLGSVGVLALASLVVQQVFGDGLSALLPGGGSGGGSTDRSGAAAGNGTETATPTANGSEVSSSGTTPEADVEMARTTGEQTNEAARPVTETAATTVQNTTEMAGSGAEDAAAATFGLPPGVLFFLGGVTVLVVLGVVWYARR
jgi:DNA-binding transcriptional ArsR family regulator